ncbi:hypothetical protein ACFYWX_04720 [Streptomyces sp. NPDC002888]|uniref:hypothetical protein n=1 Tax=Streptomyces sp. NPDC002888 TaxID=3364668 RepID=UPI003681DECD
MTGEAEGPDPHERHEPYEWHEPTGLPHKPEPKQSHAGNGTVNHHLDDQGPGGLDSDELALRRMLQRTVGEMEPRDGALDHLRRAVPARRARKRQAAVGMAAAALFIGTAIPALVHVSNAEGSDVNPSVAGQASQAQGGASQGNHPDGGESTSGTSSGKTVDKGKDGKKAEEKEKGPGATVGATSGADPSVPSAAAAPVCTAAQLGSATANVDVPDSAGIVYGTFRVTNVSDAGCTVTGQGTVTPLPQGAADGTKITVVQHASGDAAATLPDPSLYLAQLVLAPGSAYDVKFAWVPSETCPTDPGSTDGGSTGGPTPSPTPSGDGSATEGSSTGGDTGTTTQLMTEDGTADGSVVISHTPEAGSPTVSATVSNACAGVIYRTGLLAGS